MLDLSLALKKIFPLTFSQFQEMEAEKVVRDFSKDWSLENLHFFPMFLRETKCATGIVETADYEYLHHSLKEQDFSTPKSSGIYVLNPSLRILLLGESVRSLKKEPGLYAIWKWQDQVLEMKLSERQLEVLERLQEDVVTLPEEFEEGWGRVVLEDLLCHRILLKLAP